MEKVCDAGNNTPLWSSEHASNKRSISAVATSWTGEGRREEFKSNVARAETPVPAAAAKHHNTLPGDTVRSHHGDRPTAPRSTLRECNSSDPCCTSLQFTVLHPINLTAS